MDNRFIVKWHSGRVQDRRRHERRPSDSTTRMPSLMVRAKRKRIIYRYIRRSLIARTRIKPHARVYLSHSLSIRPAFRRRAPVVHNVKTWEKLCGSSVTANVEIGQCLEFFFFFSFIVEYIKFSNIESLYKTSNVLFESPFDPALIVDKYFHLHSTGSRRGKQFIFWGFY